MLITLDPEAIAKWAAAHGLGGKSYADIAGVEGSRELIAPYIDEVNEDLASWEQVKKWTILPADLTLEAGDLTPRLKVKRKAVEQKYRSSSTASTRRRWSEGLRVSVGRRERGGRRSRIGLSLTGPCRWT